jgi:ribosomal-protein-alanine N-acetyltransferase
MKDSIVIREMQMEDCEQVAYIDQLCFEHPWTIKDFKDLFRYPENYYLVAQCDDEIIGFVGLIQFVDDGDITHVAVLEQWRGRHIGQQLVETLFGVAWAHGLRAIHLEVRESNRVAQTLYHKLGFQEIGVRKNYYRHPVEDARLMVRRFETEP